MSKTWNGRSGIQRGDAWAEKWRNDAVELQGSPETQEFLKDELKYKDSELRPPKACVAWSTDPLSPGPGGSNLPMCQDKWLYKAKVVPVKQSGDVSNDNLDKVDLTLTSYRKPDCENTPMCGSSDSCIFPNWFSHKDLRHIVPYPDSVVKMSCTTFDRLKNPPNDEDMKNDLCITHSSGATNYPTDSCNGSLSVDLNRGKCAVYINGESRPLDPTGGSETSDTNPFAPTSPESSWPANSD